MTGHHQSAAATEEVVALQVLLAAVGADSVQQAVTNFKEMKQRLERFDQVISTSAASVDASVVHNGQQHADEQCCSRACALCHAWLAAAA
jgi:hypothetical protein